MNNSLTIPSVLGFHTLQWLFDLFSGEHNVDAGTELFNELLLVCDKAIVFFVKLYIFFVNYLLKVYMVSRQLVFLQ